MPKHHSMYPKYQKPTHTAIVRHASTKKQLKVRLTETKGFWATTTGVLYRKDNGLPKGQKNTAIWTLDLATLQRTGDMVSGTDT